MTSSAPNCGWLPDNFAAGRAGFFRFLAIVALALIVIATLFAQQNALSRTVRLSASSKRLLDSSARSLNSSAWQHSASFAQDLRRAYAHSCSGPLSDAVASASSDARGVVCSSLNESDKDRFCIARSVCISQERGIFLPVIGEAPLPLTPLLMHMGHEGYCGATRRAPPFATLPGVESGRLFLHGPAVVADLCESAHYAHGILTNMYGLFMQSFRLHTVLQAGMSPLETSASDAVSFIASTMYGSATNNGVIGLPLQGMLEPIFGAGSTGDTEFFVPGQRDPLPGDVHCFEPAILGGAHSCPLPADVCSRVISPQEHALYQARVIEAAEYTAVSEGTADELYGRALSSDSESDILFSANTPLFVIAQRESTRSIENIGDVVVMLEGFADHVARVACSCLSTMSASQVVSLRNAAISSPPPVYPPSLLQSVFQNGAPSPNNDMCMLGALLRDILLCPSTTAANAQDDRPRWSRPLLRWRVASLENMTVWQQVRLFSRTQIYASVRGNSNTNMAWLPLGSSFIDLCPFGWVDTFWRVLIEVAQLRHSDMGCTSDLCYPRAAYHYEKSTPSALDSKKRNLLIHTDALAAVLARELIAIYTRPEYGSGLSLYDSLLRNWTPKCL